MSSDPLHRAFGDLLSKIEREHGFRGALYRQRCLLRRVAVRMRARGLADPKEYALLLDSDPDEYNELLRVLTINVSKFFRNPDTWEVIREHVLPGLAERERPLAIWSAGSAAGEEAYSIAILLYELLGGENGKGLKGISIVGTDIDRAVLEQAKRARYPEVALSETPPQLRQRWFSVREPYRLKPVIRSLVEFKRLDILASRPEFDADLILCRNLLIYLDRKAQEQVFRMFVDVLRQGGFLVLGRVEGLARPVRRKFEVVSARERIYRKR